MENIMVPVRRNPLNRIGRAFMDDIQAEFKSNGVDGKVRVNRAIGVWIFRLVLLAAVGWSGTERLNISKFLPAPKDVANQMLVDPELAMKFKTLLREELVKAIRQIEEEDRQQPPPKRQNTKSGKRAPSPPPPPAPPGGARLRDGELITNENPRYPIFGYNRTPLRPMEFPK